jgi:hypothetical protein
MSSSPSTKEWPRNEAEHLMCSLAITGMMDRMASLLPGEVGQSGLRYRRSTAHRQDDFAAVLHAGSRSGRYGDQFTLGNGP